MQEGYLGNQNMECPQATNCAKVMGDASCVHHPLLKVPYAMQKLNIAFISI